MLDEAKTSLFVVGGAEADGPGAVAAARLADDQAPPCLRGTSTTTCCPTFGRRGSRRICRAGEAQGSSR